jgi:hypothetical protein
MSRRANLAELRWIVYRELDDDWRSPTELGRRLGLGSGTSWYRLCLTLERLANDGLAELKTPGATVRKFRRRREWS